MTLWLVWLALSYLAGSVPFGVLIARAQGVDIRKVGSGNVGATNVGRALGRKWGMLCFVLDVLKGLLPVALGGWALGFLHLSRRMVDAAASAAPVGHSPLEAWQWLALAAAAMLGHIFPVWLKFRGGKGVATALGVTLGIWPMVTIPAVAGAATWVLLVLIFRYVSLASVVGALAMPIYIGVYGWWRGYNWSQQMPFLLVTGLMALLVVWRHRGNLARLLAGTEPPIGQKISGIEKGDR